MRRMRAWMKQDGEGALHLELPGKRIAIARCDKGEARVGVEVHLRLESERGSIDLLALVVGRKGDDLHIEPARAARRGIDIPIAAALDAAKPASARIAAKPLPAMTSPASAGCRAIPDERSLKLCEAPREEKAAAQIAPPTFDLAAAMQSFDHVDTEVSGMIGSLRQMPLVDVVQQMHQGNKTARIDVKGGLMGATGSVFINKGSVVHARYGDLHGRDALRLLCEFERGTFRVRFGPAGDKRTITEPTTFLLLDVIREIDEARKSDAECEETELSPRRKVSVSGNGKALFVDEDEPTLRLNDR